MRSRSDASSNGDVEEEEAPPLPDRSKDRTFSTASSAGSSVFSQSKLDVPSPITPVSNDGRIGLHHRRKSSSHSVKETHNAITTSNPDGSRTLNQYKFGRKLGKGSFGSVELVVDTDTGVEYAVKEFSKSTLKKRAKAEMLRGKGRRNQFLKVLDQFDNDPMQLIKGEVAVMKKLDHKHIAKLFEVLDSTGDSLFMVIELCPGGSLMRLEIGEPSPPLSEADARHYFRQIVLGLEYLHYNDIAHRDIKPDNILLMKDAERTCKIVDFGVSEVFDKRGDDSGSKNAGSPAFLPPESCAPSPAGLGGFPADVWAAGVTLYALLIGRLPFESTLPMELYSLICSQEPEYPNTLSESAVDLLKTLLEKDPVKRAKIDDIRDHAWLTKDGTDPLISKEENVTYEPIAIEVEDLKAAFQPRVPLTVLRAVGKFRRLTSERKSLSATEVQRDMMSQSNNSSDTVPRPPAFSQLSTPSPERRDTLSVEDAERIIATSPDRFVPQSPDRFVVQSPVTEIPLSSSIPAHDHNN
ncbi:kinase-like protein [Atractiella rhizophila]|nr:kinase-like protein [Atractiella rhizophila]